MKPLLVFILIASAQSAPQSGFVTDLGRAESLVQVPEGCNFLSSTQKTEGGLIKGEYSYEDPIGSQITVTYQVNVDGSHYLEKRKIIKGYRTDGSGWENDNLLTADQVVEQVTTELKPTVIKIIRATVLQSNVDLNNYGNLVETILTQLKPVVTLAVNSALATSPHGHLDANELITRILVELRPFVVEAIRKEVVNKQPQITEEDIVKIVIKQLEGTVIRVIKSAVAASTDKDLLRNQEKLVQTIIVQMRPVVFQAVERALVASNVHGLNKNTLTDRIVTELTPFVRRAVGQHIKELESQKQANAGKIVTSVITDLRPIVVRIIKQSVRSYKGDLSRYGDLVKSILVSLRPVVLAEVKKALATSQYTGLNAEDLSGNIIIQLKPFVEQGVQEQVLLLQQELKAGADQIVTSVITDLRPIIIRIIRETVRSSNADLSQYDNLVQIIITQLRPVVLNEVTKALAQSTKYKNLNPQDLTQQIIVQITPFVQEGVEQQIREIEEEARITPDQIVDQIIAELKPVTIQIIKQTVASSNVNIDDEEKLVQTIVTQLRPVVFTQVTNAINANNANYNAQELSDKIVTRLIPFIREGVKREVQIKKTSEQGIFVQEIINKLDPFIKTTIKDALGSQTVTVLNHKQESGAITGVLGKLRSLIKRAVITVMTRLQAADTVNSLSDADIIAQVNVEIKNGLILKLLEGELGRILGESKPLPPADVLQGLLQRMLPEIRKMIISEITLWRQTANPQLSGAQQIRVTSNVVNSLKGGVEGATVQFLERSPDTIANSAVMQAIMGQLRQQIIIALKNDRTIQQVFASASFEDSEAFNELFQLIIAEFRKIILAQIRIYRSRVTLPPVVVPAPGGNKISNIFGTGGANSVQVETPTYNYEYNHFRSLE